MSKFTVLIVLLLWPCLHYAQTLQGKVYDEKGTVKNIKVFNKTQNSVTFTNEEGNFSMEAKVKDSIAFESLFYHKQTVVLKTFHFEGRAVFELKEIRTELDEVEVKSNPEQPVFEEKTYNADLQNIIKEDIKRNPGLYKPVGATYGVDFVYLIGMVAKLFKRKKAPNYQPITYTQIDSLFEKSTFFNKQLLTENLKIPEDHIYLFFDFCDAKQMSSELLKDENKMQLLEELVLNSQLFLILLEEYGEKKD